MWRGQILAILVDHNVSIGTNLRLNGESGSQGIYAGSAGSGGWISGKGLRNTDLFSNVHPSLNGSGPGGGRGYEIGKSTGGGSYGGSGTGGLNGGVPGLIYGDESITHLIGGSGGGHAIRGSGNAGGGGGALGITAGKFLFSKRIQLSRQMVAWELGIQMVLVPVDREERSGFKQIRFSIMERLKP